MLWKQKRDEAAAERLLSRMKGAILLFAADVWRKSDKRISREEAQAALSERCIECLDNWQKKKASPTSWMYQCLKNESYSMLNKHTREQSRQSRQISIEEVVIAKQEDDGPDRITVLKMMARLAPLSDKERAAIAWVLAGKPLISPKQAQKHAGYLLFLRCRAEKLGLLRVKRHA
jgi:DNA-directed RNA polymerase specialized sigma24 family protein